MKSGRKIGRNTVNVRDKAYWHHICTLKDLTYPIMSQAAFLRNDTAGKDMIGTRIEYQSLGKYYNMFKAGNLLPNSNKRKQLGKYVNVELKLMRYINHQARLYNQDKCGLSWSYLQKKARAYALDEYSDKYQQFDASPGWILDLLKRHNFTGVNIHGEDEEIDKEKRIATISKWSGKVLTILKETGVGPGCVYNADQTGLFYTKLPNRPYVPIDNRKYYKGAKQMKSKDRITSMICTSADGKRVTLAVVGKSKKPYCFKLCDGNPPFPYINQANTYFNKTITLWWINCVFWSHHMSVNGDVNAVSFIDN